jgi:hypothetical protein
MTSNPFSPWFAAASLHSLPCLPYGMVSSVDLSLCFLSSIRTPLLFGLQPALFQCGLTLTDYMCNDPDFKMLFFRTQLNNTNFSKLWYLSISLPFPFKGFGLSGATEVPGMHTCRRCLLSGLFRKWLCSWPTLRVKVSLNHMPWAPHCIPWTLSPSRSLLWVL